MRVFLVRFTAGVFFILLFIGGYMLVGNSHRGETLRNPAAIPKTTLFDFSALDKGSLDKAARRRLLQGAKTFAEEGRIGISLGHFLTRSSDGSALLACEFYDSITLEFEAEGIAVNGERPLLTLQAPCRATEDLTQTKPIWLPLEKILASSPADGEYSYLEESPLTIRLQNMDMAWPRHWVLSKVHLASDVDKGREIFMDRKEIYETSAIPLTMMWPEQK